MLRIYPLIGEGAIGVRKLNRYFSLRILRPASDRSECNLDVRMACEVPSVYDGVLNLK